MRKTALLVPALFAATLLFAGCFFRRTEPRVAAIIRPTTERLEAARAEKWAEVEAQAKRSIEANENTKRHKRTTAENIYLGYGGGLLGVEDVERLFDQIEEIIASRKDIALVGRYKVEQVTDSRGFDSSQRTDIVEAEEIGAELNADILIFFESQDFFPSDDTKNKAVQTINVDFVELENFSNKTVIVQGKNGRMTNARRAKKGLLQTTFAFAAGGRREAKRASANAKRAAVIAPDTEYLEAERAKKWRAVETAGKTIKENLKNSDTKYVMRSIEPEETMYEIGESSLTSVGDVKNFFSEIEETISSRNDIVLTGSVEQVLEQRNFKQSSWYDDDEAAELGKALNVDMLIFLESGDFFPSDDSEKEYATLSVKVEFFDINTLAKNTVVVEKGKDKHSAWNNDRWERTKKKLLEVELD